MSTKNPRSSNILFICAGICSLAWFVSRVIAKPSRINYPCMKAAAPMASVFLGWLIGTGMSLMCIKRAGRYFRQSRYVIAAGCIVVGALTTTVFFSTPLKAALASATLDKLAPNTPLGTARGTNPGRVVWVHDADATNWAGNGKGHWWESTNTDQAVVDAMLSSTLQALSGKSTDSAAWNTFFTYFNSTHGRGNKGYTPGEKITIKVNLVGCIRLATWGGVDSTTGRFFRKFDYMNTSPQMMAALLRQLTTVVGVAQTDITIGDPTTYFPGQFYDMLHAEFPNVTYLDCTGMPGRTKAVFSTVPVYFSSRPTNVKQDYAPKAYVDAAYLINLATFKSHSAAGVTFGAKNHYGSLIRLPNETGYYDLHQSLPEITPQMGKYRVLVDLLGHAQLGGKTMLELVDGLYGGVHPQDTVPLKWKVAPFNNDWTSSIFASQDPIALESVLFDLMQLEGDSRAWPKIAGTEDYLIEAAQASAPPSGTFYDPDHSTATTRLSSLGVHERWNNDVDRKYSRNLGTGNGIELVAIEGVAVSVQKHAASTPAGFGLSLDYDYTAHGCGWLGLTSKETGFVTLTVYDALGTCVSVPFEGYMAAGTRTIEWTALPGTAGLSRGNYVLVLRSHKGKTVRMVTNAK